MSTTTAGHMSAAAEPSTTLRASFAHCHEVSRRRARNFYYGMKLTPQPKRWALYAIYAWMRAADDLADETADPQAKIKVLEAFRRLTHTALDPDAPFPGDPMWPALRKTMFEHAIPVEHLDQMIDGQLLDQTKARYASFDELYGYCYKVASVVGLVCIRIWGHDGSTQLDQMAEHRGIAFQLTNILRDLAEDARRGRCYLPEDELERFGCDPQELGGGPAPEPFERLMAFQVDRARDYYGRGRDLEQHLDSSCRATCRAMTRSYRRLLEKIAKDPGAVLSRRVRLSRPVKLGIAVRAAMGL